MHYPNIHYVKDPPKPLLVHHNIPEPECFMCEQGIPKSHKISILAKVIIPKIEQLRIRFKGKKMPGRIRKQIRRLDDPHIKILELPTNEDYDE